MVQSRLLPPPPHPTPHPHAFLPFPHGYHTCEAHGALESTTHALEAVFNEVAKELGRGVEHLVAQLTLMVNAFLCKGKVTAPVKVTQGQPELTHPVPVQELPTPSLGYPTPAVSRHPAPGLLWSLELKLMQGTRDASPVSALGPVSALDGQAPTLAAAGFGSRCRFLIMLVMVSSSGHKPRSTA